LDLGYQSLSGTDSDCRRAYAYLPLGHTLVTPFVALELRKILHVAKNATLDSIGIDLKELGRGSSHFIFIHFNSGSKAHKQQTEAMT